MRYIVSFCIVILSTTAFNSCSKIIDLNLKGAEKKYVIEGVITNQPGSCKVLITQTKNFNTDNNFPGISGAIVSITDNNAGITTTLTETSAGIYEASSLTGISGNTYTLRVNIGNGTELFTATSVMPQAVNMDTAYVTNDNIFGEVWKLANVDLQDPAGILNQYRFNQYINGVKTKQIFVINDDILDGRKFATKLYLDPGIDDKDKLKSNDVIQIEMMCIDAAMYGYWLNLQLSASGASQSATPANPVTNIKGGALGYFSAHTLQTRSMIVP